MPQPQPTLSSAVSTMLDSSPVPSGPRTPYSRALVAGSVGRVELVLLPLPPRIRHVPPYAPFTPPASPNVCAPGPLLCSCGSIIDADESPFHCLAANFSASTATMLCRTQPSTFSMPSPPPTLPSYQSSPKSPSYSLLLTQLASPTSATKPGATTLPSRSATGCASCAFPGTLDQPGPTAVSSPPPTGGTSIYRQQYRRAHLFPLSFLRPPR